MFSFISASLEMIIPLCSCGSVHLSLVSLVGQTHLIEISWSYLTTEVTYRLITIECSGVLNSAATERWREEALMECIEKALMLCHLAHACWFLLLS